MRFFTRALYNLTQEDPTLSAPDAQARRALSESMWQQAEALYEAYLRDALPNMTRNVKDLCYMPLHDVRVARLDVGRKCLMIALDATGAPWIEEDEVSIDFASLVYADATLQTIGQSVLRHEVWVHPDNTFEFAALLEQSELCVRFGDVRFPGVGRGIPGTHN